MERLSKRKTLITLFFWSLFLRVAYILTLKNRLYFDDEFEYLQMAKNFIAGRGLIAGEAMKGFRPPLYPILLALLDLMNFNLFGIRLLQSVISSFTVLLIYYTGKRVFTERVGLWSGIIASVYPFFIFYNGFILTETLFIFLTTLTIYSFVSLSERDFSAFPAIKTGFFLGLAGLCRPIMQAYLPISFLHLFFERGELKVRVKKILLIGLFFTVTISPWVVRNYVVFKKFIPGTTMGGRVFWEGNNPYSDGGPCRYFPEEIEEIEESVREKVYYKRTIEVLKGNPSRLYWLLLNKFKRFWNIVPNAAEFTKPLYRFISIMSFGIMLPFFLLGLIISLKNKKALYIHSLILFNTLFHMIFLASIRYRVPIEPFYIILAVFGFLWLTERTAGIIVKEKGGN